MLDKITFLTSIHTKKRDCTIAVPLFEALVLPYL